MVIVVLFRGRKSSKYKSHAPQKSEPATENDTSAEDMAVTWHADSVPRSKATKHPGFSR